MKYEEREKYGIYNGRTSNRVGTGNHKGPGPELMGSETLVGNDVYNDRNENLGDIREIMLDIRSGRIGYAVLSFGGFLGLGAKLFAVPWDTLKLDTEHKRFVLNVPRDRLKAAPGFDQDDWPDMADPTWEKATHAYYGTKPY